MLSEPLITICSADLEEISLMHGMYMSLHSFSILQNQQLIKVEKCTWKTMTLFTVKSFQFIQRVIAIKPLRAHCAGVPHERSCWTSPANVSSSEEKTVNISTFFYTQTKT